jgi:two-component system, sensor histidine kinase PdtaS
LLSLQSPAQQSSSVLKTVLAGEDLLFRSPDSLNFFTQALFKSNDSLQIALGNFLLAQKLTYHSQYDAARKIFQNVIAFAEKNKQAELKILTGAEMAHFFRLNEQYETALRLLNESLRLSEKKNDPLIKFRMYCKMAELQRALGDHKVGLKYLDRAEEISKSTKIPDAEMSYMFHRKAALSENISDAEKFSLRSLEFSERCGDLHSMATSYNELGYIYGHSGNNQKVYDKPLGFYRKAEAAWRELGFYRYLVSVQNNIANEHLANGNADSSVLTCNSMIEVAEKYGWVTILNDAHRTLSSIYVARKDWEKAFYHRDKQLNYHLQDVNATNGKAVKELEIKFETENKDKALELEKASAAIEKNKGEAVSRQRNFIVAISFLLFVILVLSLLFTLRMRRKNRILSIQKNKIALINERLLQSLKQKDIYFAEMHHRVKNNLAVLAGLLELQSARTVNPEVSDELRVGIQRISILSNIHKSLYQHSESAFLQLDKVVEELAKNTLSVLGPDPEKQLKLKVIPVGISVSEIVPVSLILNELITNSCKYAIKNAQDILEISIQQNNAELEITVSDPGEGIPEGTDITELKSLGLYLVSMLTSQLGGRTRFGRTNGRFYFRIYFTPQTV